MINSNVSEEVLKYLQSKLNNLYIEILSKEKTPILKLMENNKLEGWCWETTESAILFLNDDDYIERGNLYFKNNKNGYYHSWVCFKYKNIDYVLDPCLNILCMKDEYIEYFNPTVIGTVTSKNVKEEFIRQVTTPKREEKKSEPVLQFMKFLEEICSDSCIEKRKNEIIIHGPEDVNTPFYRNGCGYITELENGKVKKLLAHYYIH